MLMLYVCSVIVKYKLSVGNTEENSCLHVNPFKYIYYTITFTLTQQSVNFETAWKTTLSILLIIL